jgi:hypothetical protein
VSEATRLADVASPDDHAAVAAVVRDYFEGWFDGSSERMDRALHPELVKRRASTATETAFPSTSKAQMMELTSRGEGAADLGDGRLEIRVEDVHGNMANVTVRGGIYREYVQLARTSEGWKIANTLWDTESGVSTG